MFFYNGNLSNSPRNTVAFSIYGKIKMVKKMIVKRLRETRERNNKKQREIAELLNVTYSTVSGWETGKDTIPLKYLITYANIYNYSLDYLFGITKVNQEYEKLEINLKEIAKNLKKIRKKYGFTMKEIAENLNYSIPCYGHYEAGRTLISTTFIYSLSKLYNNYSIDELLGRKKKIKTTLKI